MGAVYFEDHGSEEFDGHAMTIGPVLVSPEGARPALAALRRPGGKPRILTNSLAEPDDVDSLVAGMELAREIAVTAAAARGGGARAQARARRPPTATRSRPTCAGG